jgi:hypothetical protein
LKPGLLSNVKKCYDYYYNSGYFVHHGYYGYYGYCGNFRCYSLFGYYGYFEKNICFNIVIFEQTFIEFVEQQFFASQKVHSWIGRWMGGFMDGLMDVKAV